jgi:hypothetical protein
MGYRFALRRFTYPTNLRANERLNFTTWWENLGVAPCYKNFTMAVRIKNANREFVFVSGADLLEWLPGDIVHDGSFFMPADFPVGTANVQVAIIDNLNFEPRVNLAIEGRQEDGWYHLGTINIIR